MPLVEHLELPTFSRLREQGHVVLQLDRAVHQDFRELHIGFLNMMPDEALLATERQFIRLVGNCNRIAQFYVYPFSLPGLPRGKQTLDYIEHYYCEFDDLKEIGLDALIITGTNITNPNLEQEPFWGPLMDVVNWADENVASTLCSCLATHALLKHQHGIDRQPLPKKCWGVYSHRTSQPLHPLLRGGNTRFDVPHSRHNEITREQFEAAGLNILVESQRGGVHMAVSPDQFRTIYFQGHPEYDTNSLLKEYKREVMLYLSGKGDVVPAYPEHYFTDRAIELVEQFLEQTRRATGHGSELPVFPEQELEALLDNTWGDTAKALVNNWLGLVYQLTNLDRSRQYMEGVDPDDPLSAFWVGSSAPQGKL
jgi:homoserine O-succinyltransferase